jgi:hypothetical protein
MIEKYHIDTKETVEAMKRLANEIKKEEQIKITVWTNGKAIRKYTGQDTIQNNDPNHDYKHSKDKGWYKATAIIIKDEADVKLTGGFIIPDYKPSKPIFLKPHIGHDCSKE